MAAVPRVVRDIRTEKTGAHFEVEGRFIQASIKEKIEQSLEPQISAILEKLDPILADKKLVASCLGAFATMTDPDSLSAGTVEVYVLSRKLDNLTEEVKTLTRIGRNIFSDDWYVLSLSELSRFGL